MIFFYKIAKKKKRRMWYLAIYNFVISNMVLLQILKLFIILLFKDHNFHTKYFYSKKKKKMKQKQILSSIFNEWNHQHLLLELFILNRVLYLWHIYIYFALMPTFMTMIKLFICRCKSFKIRTNFHILTWIRTSAMMTQLLRI